MAIDWPGSAITGAVTLVIERSTPTGGGPWLTIKVWSAIVREPVRATFGFAFAATATVTVPLPALGFPAATWSQGVLLAAIHGQPGAVVMLTLLVDAEGPTVRPTDERLYVQRRPVEGAVTFAHQTPNCPLWLTGGVVAYSWSAQNVRSSDGSTSATL